jgi:aerobic-type carbon monoxide dehydrogenase small subunit (CoxS/CutS family)
VIEIRGRGEVLLHVNGERRRVTTRGSDTLLEVLRTELGLTGAKPGCENGDCGACTVLVDDWPAKSCLMLVGESIGRRIETIEGLRNARIQRAFLEDFAFQCGYCTSGFLMVAEGLLRNRPQADEQEQVEWLRSNICRCTGYAEILAAVRDTLAGKVEGSLVDAMRKAQEGGLRP